MDTQQLFYAADHGYKVTLVDINDRPGGVCLQRGCIPSKALLNIAALMAKARQAKEWGVKYNDPDIDLELLRNWKEDIIAKMSNGLIALCKQRNVSFVVGRGVFTNSNSVKLSDGSSITFDRCILATGSQPVIPEQFIDDELNVMDSSTALNLPAIPEKIAYYWRWVHRIGDGYRLFSSR